MRRFMLLVAVAAEQARQLAEERAARRARTQEMDPQRGEIADLKRTVEILLARTAPDAHFARARR